MDISSLIINLISGAVGGNVAGAIMKEKSLGVLGNSLAGVVGGGLGGAILHAVLPSIAHSGGDGLLSSILDNVAGGGVGGAVLLFIVSLIRSPRSQKA